MTSEGGGSRASHDGAYELKFTDPDGTKRKETYQRGERRGRGGDPGGRDEPERPPAPRA